MRGLISTCLIVRNEEQLLANCLASAAPFSDEIVVVDTGSTDRTPDIARSFGARLVRIPWTNFCEARNTYIEAARCRWILVLDADESIAPKDHEAMVRLARSRTRIGYRLTVRNYTDAHDLMWRWFPNDRRYQKEERFSRCPGWMQTSALRLFRNLPGVRYQDGPTPHTTPLESLQRLKGRIEDREDVTIHHFQHLKGGARFVAGKQRGRLEGELAHLKRFPQHRHPYLNAARTLFAEGRDAEALRHLKRALKIDVAFHDAWQLHGMIDFENGRYASAARALRRATEIDPDSPDAWALLGMVLADAGDPDAALAALQTALGLHPGHLLANNSLGVLYEDLGHQPLALRQFRKAVRLHPGFRPAAANLRRLERARAKANA
jgi:glycosyltransferase involved in cell wall biosynthesis